MALIDQIGHWRQAGNIDENYHDKCIDKVLTSALRETLSSQELENLKDMTRNLLTFIRNIDKNTLKEKDYKIEENGIWISKKVLEEVRDSYREVCKEHAKCEVLDWSAGVDLGKRDILNDILKHFENKKVTGA